MSDCMNECIKWIFVLSTDLQTYKQKKNLIAKFNTVNQFYREPTVLKENWEFFKNL